MSSPALSVAENLRKLGAVPVAEYLASRRGISGCQIETQDDQDNSNFKRDTAEGQEQQMEVDGQDSCLDVKNGGDAHVVAIERACRDQKVAFPSWVFYYPLESTNAVRWGAALRLHLKVPLFYATDELYGDENEAKSACAQFAMAEGILNAIKTAVPTSSEVVEERLSVASGMSLREWFDELPRPLPFFFEGKVLEDIHGAVTLDSWALKARGARFKLYYHFPEAMNQFTIHQTSDPVFSKRQEAKTAVCLLAISQGVEKYFQSAAEEVAGAITPELRAFSDKQILPLLNEAPPSVTRTFVYPMDRNAYACTLTVGVGAQEVEYSVGPDFGSKVDAKVAVLLVATKNGLIDFIHDGGAPLEFQARWEVIKGQVDNMPVATVRPLKRKREEPTPPALPVQLSKQISSSRSSKNTKERRKPRQARAEARKTVETTQFIERAVTGPSANPATPYQIPIAIPSKMVSGGNAAITMPMQSINPFGAPMHPLPIVPPPHFQGQTRNMQDVWPASVPPVWGNSNPNMMLPIHLQPFHLGPYQPHAFPSSPSPQSMYGYDPSYMNPGMQYEAFPNVRRR
ncbi:hypothetical protein H0H87_012381 [Tephrocybe sp. NHM501043]|nr:hypothetical protein H0H87_012381 [Tephrocybe sp. NHM501043]